MGKGARSRQNKEEALRLQQEQQQAERRKKRRTRLLTALIASVAVIALAASITIGIMVERGFFERRRIAMSSAHYKVDNLMMSFFLKDAYDNALENYETYYVSYLGLDTTKPLDQQNYDESTTWLAYFTENARNDVENLLLYAEAGLAAGLTLSDAEQASIDTQLADISPSDYGEKVSAEDVRRCLELGAMASKYYYQLVDEASYTDDEVETFFAAHRTDYLISSYKVYTLAVANGLTAEEAKTKSDELAACKTPDAFDEWVRAYLKAGDMEDDDIETAVAKTTVSSYTYYADDGFSDWLFDEARMSGDTKVVSDGKEGYIVYMATSEPKRQGKTVDVRHVLLTAKDYGSDEKAKAKAEELLAEWRAGEATESTFGDMAKTYSADTNADEGGLYEDVQWGKMVTPFNNWCFDDSRQKGDTGIVQTEFGYHILYFVGSEDSWQESVESDMTDAALEKKFEEWKKTYPLTTNQDNLDRLTLTV